MMEMFYICIVQYGGHQPPVAIERLRCGWCDLETEVFKKLFFTNLNVQLKSHMWLAAAISDSAAL